MTDKQREAHWRAEADCRTLAEAEAIKADKARHRAAVKMAREKVAELQKTIKGNT